MAVPQGTSQDTAASPDPPDHDGGGPLVVVAGWTAAGKTTLADQFAEAGLARVTGSSVLLPLLGDHTSGKTTRLQSWLMDSVERVPRDGDTDRLADLAVLRMLAGRTGGCVVESAGSLPLLVSPCNDALLIRLDAPIRVRAARVCRLLDGAVDHEQAERIVRRKDAATARAFRAAWGLDLTHPVHTRRYDLTLRCPDPDACTDPDRCAHAIGEVAQAACRVYTGYLVADRAVTGAAAAQLTHVLDRFRPWVGQIRTLLTSPGGSVSRQRWLDRLAYHTTHPDLPRMGAPC